jgi:hypothetical protein
MTERQRQALQSYKTNMGACGRGQGKNKGRVPTAARLDVPQNEFCAMVNNGDDRVIPQVPTQHPHAEQCRGGGCKR